MSSQPPLDVQFDHDFFMNLPLGFYFSEGEAGDIREYCREKAISLEVVIRRLVLDAVSS